MDIHYYFEVIESCRDIFKLNSLVLIKHILQKCKNVANSITIINYDFSLDFYAREKAHIT